MKGVEEKINLVVTAMTCCSSTDLQYDILISISLRLCSFIIFITKLQKNSPNIT
jgi:hypothetical protein